MELRCKEVINVTDGKKLGHIIDIVFDLQTGRIKGLIIPANSGFSLFKNHQQVFIPYTQICKIGEDIILVELFDDQNCKNTYILNSTNKNTDK